MSNGIVQIYYGLGRGKSRAALGNAIGAAIEGKEAIIIQFLKGKNEENSSFMERLEPEIRCFNFSKIDECYEALDDEKKAEESMNLINGFNYSKKVVSTEDCDILVLDELLGMLDLNLISVDDIKNMLSQKPEEMTIIITGRTLPDEIKDLADEIYHIEAEKQE